MGSRRHILPQMGLLRTEGGFNWLMTGLTLELWEKMQRRERILIPGWQVL